MVDIVDTTLGMFDCGFWLMIVVAHLCRLSCRKCLNRGNNLSYRLFRLCGGDLRRC